MPTTSTSAGTLVLVDDTNGITVIPQLSELRRLNWFDGKLLRADDLRVEQDHMRALVRRGNRAGGNGVVEGFTVTIGSGGELNVGPGMAIDPSGRSLLLPVAVALDAAELIARTAGVTAQPAIKGPAKPKPGSGTALKPVAAGALKTLSAGALQHYAQPTAVASLASASGAITATAAATPAFATLAGLKISNGDFADCGEPKIAGQVPLGGGTWFIVSVGWAEGLCGNEEVYGRLCEDACATSTDRPWRMDGLVFRARAISPKTALATSAAVALDARHERSLVASALFADELADASSLISGAGLRSAVWCSGAPGAAAGHGDVPLALIGRAGGVTAFLDMWTARRERMEAPPRRYWAGRMSMRPWNVFLAQVLQFQCQLSDLLDDGPAPSGPGGTIDPCAERQRVLEHAVAELEKRPLSAEDAEDTVLELLKQQMLSLRLSAGPTGMRRILVDGGIVELPPAGYLPVDPFATPSLEKQVMALLGDGVELTFCTTRHDAVARAFEEAQHLDRISLLQGLDDTKRREQVEIVVPDADVLEIAARDGWIGRGELEDRLAGQLRIAPTLDGAGRVQTRDALALRWAGRVPASDPQADRTPTASADALLEATIDRDPFSLAPGGTVSFTASADVARGPLREERAIAGRGSVHGTFTVARVEPAPGATVVRGTIDAIATWREAGDGDGSADTLHLDRAAAVLRSGRSADGATELLLQVAIDGEVLVVALTYHGDADGVDLAAFIRSVGRTPGAGPRPPAGPAPGIAGRLDVNAVSRAAAAASSPTRELGRLLLQREPGAATAGNPARITAEDTLRALEQALEIHGYTDDAVARLFPGGDGGDFRLRATRDWVLFRRRAVMRCGGAVAPPVGTDTLAVYGRVIDDGQAEPGFLGEVRFSRDSASLTAGADAVASAWSALVQGGTLVDADVVAGSPGGNERGVERAATLVAALSAVTKPRPGLQPGVLQADEVDLDPRGADGIIVIAARPPAPNALVDVAVVGFGAQMLPAYVRATAAGDVRAAMSAVFEAHFVLGSVKFALGGVPPEPAEVEAVKAKYAEQFGTTGLASADIFTLEGDDSAGDPTTRKGRAVAIGEAFDGQPSTRAFEGDEQVFELARGRGVEQSSIVVLVPARSVTAPVFAVRREIAQRYVASMAAGNFDDGLRTAFAQPTPVGEVSFSAGSSTPLAASDLDALGKKYQSLGVPPGRIDVITVEGDADADSVNLQRARANHVADALGGVDDQSRLLAVPPDAFELSGVSGGTFMLVLPEVARG